MKKICLIGGAGFIGTALSKVLLEQHYEVVVVHRETIASPLREVSYLKGDYGDKVFLQQALQGVDGVVLLAYASVPKTSFENPLADITDNLPPVLNLLEIVKDSPVQKLVILSSGGAVYGKASNLPITENMPTNPISPYGITKLAIEKYVGMYHELYGLPAVILRPGNAYGEGQRPFTGQGFIATAIASILAGREIIQYGKEGNVRDYIHVHDIALAVIAALQWGVDGQIYNVGTGIGHNNQQIVDQLEVFATTHGLSVKVTTRAARQFDVSSNVLDSTRLTQATGWQPTISFKAGLKQAWQWFIDHEA